MWVPVPKFPVTRLAQPRKSPVSLVHVLPGHSLAIRVKRQGRSPRLCPDPAPQPLRRNRSASHGLRNLIARYTNKLRRELRSRIGRAFFRSAIPPTAPCSVTPKRNYGPSTLCHSFIPRTGKPIWFKFAACKSEKFPLLRSKIDTFAKTVSRCGFASSFLFCMAKRGNQQI
jgi:hypothetical protein